MKEVGKKLIAQNKKARHDTSSKTFTSAAWCL